MIRLLIPAGNTESVKCSLLQTIACFLSSEQGERQVYHYINRRLEISPETYLEKTLCTGSPAEAEIMELAAQNTTGRLVFQRRNYESSTEAQEKLRVVAAGEVPTELGVLLKIMTVASVCVCVWVAGALFKVLLLPFHAAYSCMLP